MSHLPRTIDSITTIFLTLFLGMHRLSQAFTKGEMIEKPYAEFTDSQHSFNYRFNRGEYNIQCFLLIYNRKVITYNVPRAYVLILLLSR